MGTKESMSYGRGTGGIRAEKHAKMEGPTTTNSSESCKPHLDDRQHRLWPGHSGTVPIGGRGLTPHQGLVPSEDVGHHRIGWGTSGQLLTLSWQSTKRGVCQMSLPLSRSAVEDAGHAHVRRASCARGIKRERRRHSHPIRHGRRCPRPELTTPNSA